MPFADLAAAEVESFGPSLLGQAEGGLPRFKIATGSYFEPLGAATGVQVVSQFAFEAVEFGQHLISVIII